MSATLSLLSIVAAMFLVPASAAVLRRALPPRSGLSPRLEPVHFGQSPKVRRSPRHAVLLHRALMSGFFVAVIGLSLLPAAVALREVGATLISGALAFVLPTLLVTLHARQGSRRE